MQININLTLIHSQLTQLKKKIHATNIRTRTHKIQTQEQSQSAKT